MPCIDQVAVGISGVFLLLVGLSIPPFFSSPEAVADVNWAAVAGHGEKLLPGTILPTMTFPVFRHINVVIAALCPRTCTIMEP